jgi:hypothetical protein
LFNYNVEEPSMQRWLEDRSAIQQIDADDGEQGLSGNEQPPPASGLGTTIGLGTSGVRS